MISDKTCILFFAQDAVASAVGTKKNLLLRKRSRIQAIDYLLQSTLSALKSTKIPIERVTSDMQHGDTFGERLSNAATITFDKGYDRLIIVGDDCPSLDVHTVIRASADLSTDNVVLGPASDGGVYLIGLQKQNFDPYLFQNLAWESGQLQQDLEVYATQQGCDTVWYDQQDDIDSFKDLWAFVHNNSLSHKELIICLNSIIDADRLHLFQGEYKYVLSNQISFGLLRAPPAV